MPTMQLFYTRLFHAPEVYDPNLVYLAELTKVSRDQVQVLKTVLSWSFWPATTE